jgi:hypothetical protein
MFHRLFRSRKHGRPATQFTLPDRWNKSFLQLERLDDRIVPSFSPAVNYAAGIYPQEVVAADFNNDGILDLAAAYAGSDIVIPDPGSGAVGVRLGNGDGTFGSAINSAVGHSPTSLAVGDFNGDGKLDLVTGDYNYGGTTTDVTVLLGNGDGSFQTPASIDLSYPGGFFGNGVESVAVGDFNGDNKLDLLAVANYYGVEFLSYDFQGLGAVLLGTGTGTFEAPQWSLLNPSYTTSAAVDDFNGDGKLDIASVSDGYYGAAGYLTVSLGNGDGTFGYRRVISDRAGESVIASDLNNDGRVDLATASYAGVAVFLGTGTGSFGTPHFYAAGASYGGLAAADFNGDGKLDLIASNYSGYAGTVDVLLGDGVGAFALPVYAAVGAVPVGVAVGDFNGDGLTDAATANNASYNVSVLLNDGIWDGSPPPSPPPSVTIGDRAVTEGNTGTAAATFSVTLSAASTETITVAYATGDGTATAGSDYRAASGTLTFAPGETEKTITVLVIGDRLPEPNETFAVNLSAATNATIADVQATGTIVDDEPRISIGDVTRSEGGRNKKTQFTFTVTLSAAYDQAVTVSFRTTDGTATTGDGDYVAKTGTITFLPGVTTKTITITVKGDTKKETDEVVYLDLFDSSSNSLLAKSRGTGMILNDD